DKERGKFVSCPPSPPLVLPPAERPPQGPRPRSEGVAAPPPTPGPALRSHPGEGDARGTFSPLEFKVVVKDDSAGTLKGALRARLTPGGLFLGQGTSQEVLLRVGTPAEYLGGSRLAVTPAGRRLELSVTGWRVYPRRLARDVADFLGGEMTSLNPESYVLP